MHRVAVNDAFTLMKKRILTTEAGELITLFNMGVYYQVCSVHVRDPRYAELEPHTRISPVSGMRELFPACQRGCEPRREALVLSRMRPTCPNCFAVYRIEVPIGVQPSNVIGPHAIERVYCTLPRTEWPEHVVCAISNQLNEIDTPHGPLYWAREESMLMWDQLALEALPPPIQEVSWNELRSMSLNDYVEKYAMEYGRIRDPIAALLHNYAPITNNTGPPVTVLAMSDEDGAGGSMSMQEPLPTVEHTNHNQALVLYSAPGKMTSYNNAHGEFDTRSIDMFDVAPCGLNDALIIHQQYHGQY